MLGIISLVLVMGNTMPHEEVRYQTMSKERTTYVAAWFGPYIICAIPSGSLVVAFLGVATSLGQHPAALVFSAIVIALSIPFAVVGAFRFAWWIEDMYNQITSESASGSTLISEDSNYVSCGSRQSDSIPSQGLGDVSGVGRWWFF